MAKKLISVWLALTILLCSSISIFAEETVTGTFFFREIRINGTQIWNYELNRPFFLYNGVTYVPMSEGVQGAMGLQCEMDCESRTLKILKTDITKKQVKDAALANDMNDIKATVVNDVKVVTYTSAPKETEASVLIGEAAAGAVAAEAAGAGEAASIGVAAVEEAVAEMEAAGEETVIQPPVLIAHDLDLEGLPVMSYGGTLYLPLKALTDDPNLGISIYYESYSGVYVSTDPAVDAKSYWDEARYKYNKGLVSYIRKFNSSISVARAQELVALFQHEARIHGLDETLLMAIAHRESTFNTDCRARSGATGIMQIMPRTAAGYGVQEWQLYDAHMNIKLGAKLISGQLAAYNGDMVKALSAYNQGSGRVNRGSYSTTYATKILNQKETIVTYLTSNGFGLGK